MSRPVHRRVSTLLLAASTAVLTLVMTAGPAVATEGEEAGAAGGFGTGQWDGMILAFVIGVLLGILAFALSKPGEIHRADH